MVKLMGKKILTNLRQIVLFTLSYCLFVCFVALRPKSTGMVMVGWSVYLTTLFPEQA